MAIHNVLYIIIYNGNDFCDSCLLPHINVLLKKGSTLKERICSLFIAEWIDRVASPENVSIPLSVF